ncbi:hypothetical protein HMPREF1087_01206 [[Clostridium] clostridioforme 90A1]|jgi:hypothetical protein|nr:hypothetical protein HMPREF1087_01206 [[Clostridium] clostridioforme 90A1]ENZ72465.1 hypothetical protein HMPREF1081_00882 [[Clostridium] clostridioforme 90A4]
MLNIAKFQNNFKLSIQGGIKMVNEWTKEGEGKFCQYSGMEYYNGNFDVDIHANNRIGELLLAYINKCNYSDFKESDLSIIDNRVSWNQIEDSDCNILDTTEEQEREEKCYICDYTVFVSINGIELEEYDLREMLPKAN